MEGRYIIVKIEDKRKRGSEQIEIGDLVMFRGEKCILSYNTLEEVYPYSLIRVDNFKISDSFKSFKGIDASCTLVSKHNNLKLVIE